MKLLPGEYLGVLLTIVFLSETACIGHAVLILYCEFSGKRDEFTLLFLFIFYLYSLMISIIQLLLFVFMDTIIKRSLYLLYVHIK